MSIELKYDSWPQLQNTLWSEKGDERKWLGKASYYISLENSLSIWVVHLPKFMIFRKQQRNFFLRTDTFHWIAEYLFSKSALWIGSKQRKEKKIRQGRQFCVRFKATTNHVLTTVKHCLLIYGIFPLFMVKIKYLVRYWSVKFIWKFFNIHQLTQQVKRYLAEGFSDCMTMFMVWRIVLVSCTIK